ncbi:MAG: LysM peptidoglycan-binding domain-containing protein [Acidimicrobiales bacterium]
MTQGAGDGRRRGATRRGLVPAVVALAGALWLLAGVGHGDLAAPPVTGGRHAITTWAAQRDAPTIAMALIRVAAMAAAAYLIGAIVIGLAARGTGSARAVRLVDRVTLPILRRALGGITAASLLVGPVGAVPAMALSTDAPRIVPLDPVVAPAPRPPPVPRPTAEPRATATWTVRRGDNFWDIAASTLRTSWRFEPTNGQILVYWRALISANRSRLVDRANPDLVFPDQVFILPDAGAPPPHWPAAAHGP